MKDITDIKKTDYLAAFLDNKIIRTRPFGPNKLGEKAYDRVEKIVAALHLLTSHIQADEPLRQLARKTGLQLLNNLLLLRDEMRVSNSSKIKNTRSSIRELISLLRILAVSGFISIQNAEVLIDAVDELSTLISSAQRSPLSESVLIVKENLLGASFNDKLRNSVAGQVSRSARITPQNKQDLMDITDSKELKDSTFPYKDNIRANRVKSILDTLGSGELGIKDISGQLPEYSEKMIQRELAALILSGKVRKSGFKRWSRYAIV